MPRVLLLGYSLLALARAARLDRSTLEGEESEVDVLGEHEAGDVLLQRGRSVKWTWHDGAEDGLASGTLPTALVQSRGGGTGVDMPWTQSFQAGYRDGGGNYVGASEVTHLATFSGKLWAGTGYWKEKAEHKLPATVLRLDEPSGQWQIDLDMGKQADFSKFPNARFKYILRVTILKELSFTKDKDDKEIPKSSVLLAAGMAFIDKNTRSASVFTRGATPASWTNKHFVAGDHRPEPRDAEVFTNPKTGKQRAFLLVGDQGVLSGSYNSNTVDIDWSETSETIRGSLNGARALGLVGAGGMLFFSAGDSLYMRSNDDETWSKLMSLTSAGEVNNEMGGIRGLSVLPSEASLLVCWAPDTQAKGNIVRIDNHNLNNGGHEETTLQAEYKKYMEERPEVRNAIQNLGCYNEFYPIVDPATQEMVHITGFETLLEGGRWDLTWNNYYGGGTYVIRRSGGAYEVGEINGHYEYGKPVPLAPRTFISSPFPGEEQVLYAAGFDANWINVHNTAWIFKGGYNQVFGRATTTATTTTTPQPACQICPESKFKANALAGYTKKRNPYSAYTCQEAQTYYSKRPGQCSKGQSLLNAACCECTLCPGKKLKPDAVSGWSATGAYTCAESEKWINSETTTMTCAAAAATWGEKCCEA